MTTPDPYYTPAPRAAVARDVLALLLIVVAVAGLTWVSFETDWRLGVAALSLAAGAAGAALGMNR